jgi:L-alanine-DL-glutamate epimerase-like enolase superfamily enzyme
MKLSFTPFTIVLKHPFSLSSGSRLTTPCMLIEVEHEGLTGFGEASMPPYLGESIDTASSFLEGVAARNIAPSMDPGDLQAVLDALAPGNHAAKAAVDIAVHDWIGKNRGEPLYRMWGMTPEAAPTSYTIGVGPPEEVRQRVAEAADVPILKLKMGSEKDREMMEAVRSVTDRPVRVDVNQGWQSAREALPMIEWLATQNVEFVEQPLPAVAVEEQRRLRERSPLPIVADEAVVRYADLGRAAGLYDGVNIKLMKCTGLWEARRMIHEAHRLGMKVMLGCMTETSCGISAAAHLAPMADWVDLDGALLISNDPFIGVEIRRGNICFNDLPGIGITKRTTTS